MNIKENLDALGLNTGNSIVIGSGILNALHIRESHDIDVVVSEDMYQKFLADPKFKKEDNHGQEVLVNDIFEVGLGWTVLGRRWSFEDFLGNSVVINDVRYISLQFLLEVKESWLLEPDARQKDKDDVALIQNYLEKIKSAQE